MGDESCCTTVWELRVAVPPYAVPPYGSWEFARLGDISFTLSPFPYLKPKAYPLLPNLSSKGSIANIAQARDNKTNLIHLFVNHCGINTQTRIGCA
jgi:hypothetical protein